MTRRVAALVAGLATLITLAGCTSDDAVHGRLTGQAALWRLLEPRPADATEQTSAWAGDERPTLGRFTSMFFVHAARDLARMRREGARAVVHRSWSGPHGEAFDVILIRYDRADQADVDVGAVESAGDLGPHTGYEPLDLPLPAADNAIAFVQSPRPAPGGEQFCFSAGAAGAVEVVTDLLVPAPVDRVNLAHYTAWIAAQYARLG